MHPIELRLHANTVSPGDLIVTVQEQTFEFLKSTSNPEIRVSAYLDREWPMVESRYEELYVSEVLSYKVTSISAGSKIRKVTLPCAMHPGEQLTLTVRR